MLMLTLLPLQLSAAEVGTCCGHVKAMQALQSTYHRPAHGLSAVAQAGVDVAITNGSSFDLDCGTCHANCAAAVFTTTATMADPAGMEPSALFVESLLSSWHEQPYRPQWSAPTGSGWNAVA